MVRDSAWESDIVIFSISNSDLSSKIMTRKIFSWRQPLILFAVAVLLLGFMPGSVNAFSDEQPPDPGISDEPPPPPPSQDTDEPDDPNDQTLDPPINTGENVIPPQNGQEPENETAVGGIEEPAGETDTTDLVEPTPTIEAGPDINQPNVLESTAETEGETAVDISEDTVLEPTPTLTEETPEPGGQTSSEPSLNPPIDAPNVEFVFSGPVGDAVNQAAVNIIDQSSGFDISGGESGGEGGSSALDQALTTLLTGSSIDSANFNVLVQGLLQILGAPSREIAEQLVRSLLGLLKDGKVDPRRLWAAINAYNAFIEASSPEFLENPPIELVMIRAILSDLVEAAIAADIRSRN